MYMDNLSTKDEVHNNRSGGQINPAIYSRFLKKMNSLTHHFSAKNKDKKSHKKHQ